MKKFLATLAVMIIMIPAISMAQHCELLRQAEDLELTDQQIDQIRAISLDEHKQMIQNRADLQLAELELRELMMADNLDKAKIMKKSDEISTIKAKMAKTRLEKRIDRMNILTAEQRAKAKVEMRKRGGRDGIGFGPGQGPGMRGNRECPNNDGPRQGKHFNRRSAGDNGDQGAIMNEDLERDTEFAEMEDF